MRAVTRITDRPPVRRRLGMPFDQGFERDPADDGERLVWLERATCPKSVRDDGGIACTGEDRDCQITDVAADGASGGRSRHDLTRARLPCFAA